MGIDRHLVGKSWRKQLRAKPLGEQNRVHGTNHYKLINKEQL